jgi:hypothetical protein
MKQSCQGICSDPESADIEAVLKVARLDCLIFLGYDPHVDGDEPPRL